MNRYSSMLNHGFWRAPKSIELRKEVIFVHHVPIPFNMTRARSAEILYQYDAKVKYVFEKSNEFKIINLIVPSIYNADAIQLSVEIDVITCAMSSLPSDIIEKLTEVQKVQQDWILRQN